MKTKKQQQQERLAQVRERLRAARDERARLREALATVGQGADAGAVAVTQAKLDEAEQDVEYLTALENAVLSQVSGMSAADRFGGTLASNLDAQRVIDRPVHGRG